MQTPTSSWSSDSLEQYLRLMPREMLAHLWLEESTHDHYSTWSFCGVKMSGNGMRILRGGVEKSSRDGGGNRVIWDRTSSASMRCFNSLRCMRDAIIILHDTSNISSRTATVPWSNGDNAPFTLKSGENWNLGRRKKKRKKEGQKLKRKRYNNRSVFLLLLFISL